MNAVIQFDVSDQIITRTDDIDVVSDSIDYLQAKFNFKTAQWLTGAVTAQFRGGKDGQTYEVLLDSDNMCTVPHEALAINGGFMYVTCFTGTLITATAASVYVIKSGYDGNAGSSQPPTPSVYEQLLSRIADLELHHNDIDGGLFTDWED